MTIEECRDILCKEKTDEKLKENYKVGYIDGVFDFYNKAKELT